MDPVTKGRWWGIYHSLWMLWTLVPTLGWVAFLWIGARSHKRLWQVWAAIYFVVFFIGTWGTVVFEDSRGSESLSGLIGTLIIFSVPIVLVHAAFVRREYLLRMRALAPVEADRERQEAATIRADFTDVDAEKRARALFAQCNDLVDQIEDQLELARESASIAARTQYQEALEARSEGEHLVDKARRPHEFEQAESVLKRSLDGLQSVHDQLAATAH